MQLLRGFEAEGGRLEIHSRSSVSSKLKQRNEM